MAGTAALQTSWVDQLVANASCYTYKRIPKQISTGYGLTEAPRGALGHWIKIEGRKVAKYQCVVPSTWNFSPKGALNQHSGPLLRQALIGSTIGTNSNRPDRQHPQDRSPVRLLYRLRSPRCQS